MENFVNYKRYRWMLINLVGMCALLIFYWFDQPLGGRSGGSWLGYTYGFLAAFGIMYLMWFGVRKRSYRSNVGTLQGWLSAHVWLGISLILLVPLHSAFQFGFNVHTLAYALMLIVIFSGIYGAIRYLTLAPEITAHRGAPHTKKLLEAIQQLDRDIDKATQGKSDSLLALRLQADFVLAPSVWLCRRRQLVPTTDTQQEAKLLSVVPEAEQVDATNLLGVISRKRLLALQLQEDVRTLSILQMWLYLHVPVSLALVVAVAIHIFVVFWYR
jgi:hypothetical protein